MSAGVRIFCMSQRILITGANRGIGLATATALLEAGHNVLAGTRETGDAPELQALREAHPAALTVLEIDVSSDESVAAAVTQASEAVPGLDVLINNAGLFPEDGSEELAAMELDHFRAAFEVNVIGTARMIQAFTPLLEKGGRPRIVNISSGAASILGKTNNHYYAYSTSKAALNMLTRAIAAEYEPRGICVVALTPGWVQTRMGGDKAPLSPEESGAAIAGTVVDLPMEMTGKFLERTGQETRYKW